MTQKWIPWKKPSDSLAVHEPSRRKKKSRKKKKTERSVVNEKSMKSFLLCREKLQIYAQLVKFHMKSLISGDDNLRLCEVKITQPIIAYIDSLRKKAAVLAMFSIHFNWASWRILIDSRLRFGLALLSVNYQNNNSRVIAKAVVVWWWFKRRWMFRMINCSICVTKLVTLIKSNSNVVTDTPKKSSNSIA